MDFFEAHEEDESSEEIDLLGNSSRLDTGQPDNTKSNAMDFFGTHEDESTEEIDLLGSSSHETSAKDEKKVDSKVVQQQAMQHATPLGTEPVKKTPRSASLLFKLDELERQWTHQDVSTNKNNNPPERNPIDNLNLFVPQSTAPFSPYANSEISPITWGNSPMMVSVDHGAKLDDDSISTFGSLGSPGIGFAPAPKQLFGQNMTSTARQLQGGHRQSNDDQKPARKPSLFDRLHRGEKRATSATPKNPPTSTTKSVRKLVFGTPNNKKPPTPKPTTSGKPKKAFIFMQRKSKVMPLPPPTSTIPVSQQPTAHSLPQTQRSGSGSASNKKSVFDRLYRNERRSTNLWRDPGAKWGEKYQFIAAGGAAKTSMIPLAGIPATPGVKRKLFLPLSPVPSSPENKKLACLLQNAWRYRQAHSQLIGKLAQQWSVTCYPTDGIVTANRILRLRLGIQARAVAIRRADLSSMGKGTTVGEQEVSFETIQEICFQAWDDDEHVLQKYSVHVQCQAKMIQLLRTWRPEKLAFLLYKCALELSTEYETNNLMHAAAGLLQQWFFSFARKQALSCDDGNNTPQERQQLQSLNWFHNRLEREAGPAVWARFDDAATVIQAAFRMFSAKRYLDLNYSSLAVYRTWRESRQRLREGASLKIQALYRGHHVRRRLGSSTAGIIVEAWTQRKNATKAICVVQSYVRMILVRARYRRLKHSIARVQALQRGWRQRSTFLSVLLAIVRLQATWRASQLRQQMYIVAAWKERGSLIRHRSAVKLQSLVRMCIARNAFQNQRTSVVRLQAMGRSWLAHRQAAVLKLQCWMRMVKSAAKLEICMTSVRILQQQVRTMIERTKYLHCRRAVLIIQGGWRGRRVRSNKLRQGQATIEAEGPSAGMGTDVATLIRPNSCPTKNAPMPLTVISAIRIQRNYRSFHPQQAYSTILVATLKIQRIARGHLTRVHHHRNLQMGSAIRIQSIYRSFHPQQAYQTILVATLKIQRFARCHLTRSHRYKSLLVRSATTIQSAYRSFHPRQAYRTILVATLKVQRIMRGYLVRLHQQQFLAMRRERAAMLIQSAYRSFHPQQAYQTILVATLQIQRLARGHLSRTHHYRNLELRSATTIQSAYRSFHPCHAYRAVLVATLKIQGLTRGYLARLHQHQYLATRKERAAILIQRVYRSFHPQQAYRTILVATLQIQRLARGHLSRAQCYRNLEARSATTIQSAYRSFHPRQAFRAVLVAALKIETSSRGYLARSNLVAMRQSALEIQGLWRRQLQKRANTQRQNAAVKLQVVWRGFYMRQEIERNEAARVIQSVYRRFHLYQAFLAARSATLALQRIGRGYLARSDIKVVRRAALVLQAAWRKQFAKIWSSAVVIQRLYRGTAVRERLARRQNAAGRLQKTYRGFRNQKLFRKLRASAVLLQSVGREFSARSSLVKQRLAVTRLQALGRSALVRRRLQASNEFAATIQRSYRSYCCRDRYLRVIRAVQVVQKFAKLVLLRCQQRTGAAIMIEAQWRGSLVRAKFSRLRRSLVALQSCYRTKRDRCMYLSLRWKVVCAQATLRRYFRRTNFLKCRHAILIIQRSLRRYLRRQEVRRLMAQKILDQLRAYKQRQQYLTVVASTITLQTFWRSSLQRHVYHRICKSIVISQSLLRRYLILKRLKEQQTSATTIQRIYQIKKQNLPGFKARNAAVILQRQMRSWIQRKNLATLKLSLQLLPAHTKKKFLQKFSGQSGRVWGCRVRLLLRDRFQMAICIQRWWRCSVNRSKFVAQRQSSIRIQRWLRRSVFPLLRTQENAATGLAAWWRRSCQESHFAAQRKSARRIQSWLRQVVFPVLRTQRLAATRLAAWYRSRIVAKNYRQLILCSNLLGPGTLENLLAKVQGSYFGAHVRGQLHVRSGAATRLCNLWRKRAARSRYLEQRRSALVISRSIRAYFAIAKAKRILVRLRTNHAIRVRRPLLEDLSLYHSQKKLRKATVVLQDFCLTIVTCSRYRRQRLAAIAIQAWWETHYKRRRLAAITIQAWWKSVLPVVQSQRVGAMKIQSWFRKLLSRRNTARLLLCGAYLSKSTLNAMSMRVQSPEWGSHIRRQLKLRANSAVVVQRDWRAYHYNMAYSKQKMAVLLLQATFRGWIVNHKLTKFKNGVQIVQNAWRTYCAKALLVRTRQAVAIQSLVRMFSSRQQYFLLQESTKKIQSCWRCHKAQLDITQIRCATVAIQSAVRMSSACQYYRAVKLSVQKIQSSWRSHQAQVAFARARCAVVTIQGAVRSGMAMRQYHLLRASIQSIQSTWRSHQAQVAFARARCAVVTIQGAARRSSSTKRLVLSSAMLIQSAWRSYQSQLAGYRNSAVVIQATTRAFLRRKQYVLIQLSVRQIQCAWRSHWGDQVGFSRSRHAVGVIQRATRAYCTRKQFLFKMSSAQILQSAWRSWKAQADLVRARQAIGVIQSATRAYCARKQYLVMLLSAQTLQSSWRRWKAQAEFTKVKTCAVVAQEVGRMHSAQSQFSFHQQLLPSVIQSQAVARGWLARASLQRKQKYAVMLQSKWRCYMHQRHFQEARTACIILQCFAISIMLRQQREQFAVVRIQSIARGWRLRQRYLYCKECTIMVQATWRSYQGQICFARFREAIVTVQGAARGYLARKQYRQLQCLVALLIKVQAAVRRWLIKEQLERQGTVVATIQSCWRAYHYNNAFRKQRVATIAVQSLFRGWQCKQHLLRCKNSTLQIQTVWRSYHVQVQFRRVRGLVILIQCEVRRYLSKKQFKQRHESIATLQRVQAAVRGWLTRVRLRHERASSTLIQSHWRAYRQWQRFQQVRKACIILQCFTVSVLLHLHSARLQAMDKSPTATRAHHDHARYLRRRAIKAAVKKHNKRKQVAQLVRTQAVIRGWLQSKKLHQQVRAVTSIQHQWRASHSSTVKAVVILQKGFRGWSSKNEFRRCKNGAQRIQASWRGHHASSGFVKARRSSLTIQRSCRMYLARKQYQQHQDLRVRRVRVQAAVRGWLQRHMLMKQTLSCTTIQSQWRSHHSNHRFLRMRESALILQRAWKVRSCQQKLLRCKTGAKRIQSMWRIHQARRKQSQQVEKLNYQLLRFQAAVRGWLQRKRLTKQALASTSIQSLWRSYHGKLGFVQLTMAAVVIQRNFRGSNIFGRALKRKNSAASMIQAKFIEWKLNISLLAVQSSLVLLKRTPSASFFAIQHINRELQAAMLFSRSLTLSGGDWDQAIADFENHASIIIQRAVKRLLVKKQAVAHWNSISAEARLSSDTNFGLASGDNELLSWLLMFQVRQALEEQNQSARSIQRWYLERSRWLAACVVIQSRVRVWLARRRVYRLNVQRAAKRCAEFYDELEATLLARVYRAASEQAERDVKHLLSHDEPSKVPSKSGICVRRIAQRVVLGRLRAENEKDEVNSAKDLLAAEQGRVDRLVL